MKQVEYQFDEVVTLFDKQRVPLSSMERSKRQGSYRYYGAQGIIDYIDDYIFDGEYILLAEDGENLKSNKQDLAQLVDGKFWVNNHAHILRTKEVCRLRYFYFWINSKNLTEYVTGSAQPKLSQGSLKKMIIPLPTLEIQDKILSIITPIDEKIKENARVNDNLTQQARSLYQAWFVDYEPFGGSAPSDWSNVSLGQVAIMKTDSWSPVKNPDDVVEHYSIPAYDEQYYPVFESATDIKSNKYILTPDSVMISKLNPDTKRIWRPICLSANSVCSTEFIVYEARKNNQKDFIYSILDSVPFFNYLCAHTTGSTNSRQRATPKATLDFSFQLPPDNVIKDFCQLVTPMYDLIASNIVENQSLAQTRDGLLPRLMSGELDVSDIDI